jgi:MFS family permease
MPIARARILWRPIAAVAAGATLFTTVQGLSYPLLAVVLYRRGAPETFIGFNTAMMPLGMIVAAPVATAMMRRIGGLALAAGSICGAALCLLLIGAIKDPWIWMPLRLFQGLSLACVFVVTDTWVNQLAPAHARGRVLGFYSMLTSVGFAFGPALLLIVGTEGWAPFLAGAACGLLSLVPLVASRAELPARDGEPSQSILAFFPLAPVLLAGAAAAALADQAAMSMLPIFTLRYGMDVSASNITLIVMVAGSIGLQYPVGWLADRVPRRALYVACALTTAAGAALMPITVHAPLFFWLVIFVWGGAYYAIYTLSLVRLGERFRGAALIAGNAAFAAMWGAGGLVGTPAIGAAMQHWGPIGLSIVIASLFVVLAMTTLLVAET